MSTPAEPQPEPTIVERGDGISVTWTDTLDPNGAQK